MRCVGLACQDILQNLESSQAERIEMEKSAANLRAAQQQERENQHHAEMRELERVHAETKNQLQVPSPFSFLSPLTGVRWKSVQPTTRR
jgi:hypothetical protein